MSDIAGIIDHTLLKPETTHADIADLVADAVELGTYSVCVSPTMLPVTGPADSDLKVAVVCGFPSGKHHSSVKAAEAALAAGLDALPGITWRLLRRFEPNHTERSLWRLEERVCSIQR